MERIIEIIKRMNIEWGFYDLQIATNYERSETIVSFYLDYMEERASDPFLSEVFPVVKNFSFKGTSDRTGRVFVEFVFDGTLNEMVN